MIEKILVPLDGSAFAEQALPQAEAIAKASGASILLLRAQSIPAYADEFAEPKVSLEESQGYLDGLAAKMVERGITTETVAAYANPVGLILEQVETRDLDLVVMATHGRSGLGRWVYGSVAEAVLAHSPVPVLLVHAWQEGAVAAPLPEKPKLLVPLDGSEFSEAVLPDARAFAAVLGGEIVLMTAVIPPATATMGEYGRVVSYLDQEVDALQANARGYLNDVAQVFAEKYGVRPRGVVGVGEPSVAIEQVAREEQASFIVMATHGRTGVSRLRFGSVAGRVLRRATPPVLLVRPAPVVTTVATESTAVPLADGTAAVTATLSLSTSDLALLDTALHAYRHTLPRHDRAAVEHLIAQVKVAQTTALGMTGAVVAESQPAREAAQV